MNKRDIVLMMIRCGYVETDLSAITPKIIPAFLWRGWNYILIYSKPGYKQQVREVLKSIMDDSPCSLSA